MCKCTPNIRTPFCGKPGCEPRAVKTGEFVLRVGRLVSIEDVTPPVTQVLDYIFETVSAKAELRLRGKTIDTLPSYCNWTESEEGVAETIKGAKEYVAENQIGPGSDIEVVVLRVAEQYRMRPLPNPQGYTLHEPFRTLDYGSRWRLPQPVETIVWSSRRPEDNPIEGK
jgi:hypothetical protein